MNSKNQKILASQAFPLCFVCKAEIREHNGCRYESCTRCRQHCDLHCACGECSECFRQQAEQDNYEMEIRIKRLVRGPNWKPGDPESDDGVADPASAEGKAEIAKKKAEKKDRENAMLKWIDGVEEAVAKEDLRLSAAEDVKKRSRRSFLGIFKKQDQE